VDCSVGSRGQSACWWPLADLFGRGVIVFTHRVALLSRAKKRTGAAMVVCTGMPNNLLGRV